VPTESSRLRISPRASAIPTSAEVALFAMEKEFETFAESCPLA
jgi:hypothetical protein